MQNLRIFKTEENYNKNTSLKYPTISYIEDNDKVFFQQEKYITAIFKLDDEYNSIYEYNVFNNATNVDIDTITINDIKPQKNIKSINIYSTDISWLKDENYDVSNATYDIDMIYKDVFYLKIKPINDDIKIKDIKEVLLLKKGYDLDNGYVSMAIPINISDLQPLFDYENNQIIINDLKSIYPFETVGEEDCYYIYKQLMLCVNDGNIDENSSGYTKIDTNIIFFETVKLKTNETHVVKFKLRDSTIISDCIFAYNDGLVDIKLYEGISVIGKMAFNGCYSLNSITIPSTVTQIGDYCFYNTSLHEINFLSNIPPLMGEKPFSNYDKRGIITHPKGTNYEILKNYVNFCEYDEDTYCFTLIEK